MHTLLATFAVSCITCLMLTPGVRALAFRCGLVDRPDGRRKVHAKVTPLGGGLAIFGSAVIGVAAACYASPFQIRLLVNLPLLLGLFASASVIAAAGLLDDFHQLSGKRKLLLQLVAVAIVMYCGVSVHRIQFFGWIIELGPLSIPFTAFLLLGAVNSLNLIDGMDGLLSCVGFIICLAMGAMAVLCAQWAMACVAMALAGSLLGFLKYNFPPASIFMGDCGSMVVGLVIGVLAIESSLKGPATVALAAPLAVLTIPILDTFAAIIRRKFTGRSLYATDRGHLHHCLLRCGLSNRRALIYVSTFCLITLIGALASVALQNELMAIVSATAVVTILIVTRLFGYAEFTLIKDHLAEWGNALFRGRFGDRVSQLEVRLQGSGNWGNLWKQLVECAEELNLRAICLDVNAPAIQEGYFARWGKLRSEPDNFELWRAQLPLLVGGLTVGRLEVVGKQNGESTFSQITALATRVEDLGFVFLNDARPGMPLSCGHAGTDQPETSLRAELIAVGSNGSETDSPEELSSAGSLRLKPR